MIEVKTQGILKGGGQVLDLNYELSVNKGEFVSIVGESGIGKSSLLRLVSGLDSPQYGGINLNDKTVFSSDIAESPGSRNCGMIFQEYALFPHLTVEENIQFVKPNMEESQLNKLLESLDLLSLRKQHPSTLSGGQQQRTALARLYAQNPSIILLDEPFSAQDKGLQSKLMEYLKNFQRKNNSTVIMVTHNWMQAFSLSDRVFQMEIGGKMRELKAGQIAQKAQGVIVSKTQEGESYIFTVLIGGELVNIPTNKVDFIGFELGQSVPVNIQF